MTEPVASFSAASARSKPLVIGVSAAIAIETIAVHFLVRTRAPLLAWLLTLSSAWVIVWLARDYTAMGRARVEVADESLRFAIGRRADFSIARPLVGRAIRPTFRDIPVAGTTQGADYVNLTKPATPNVILFLTTPTTVPLPFGIQKTALRLALYLDDADGFLRVLG